jgi:HEAT repeat protein
MNGHLMQSGSGTRYGNGSSTRACGPVRSSRSATGSTLTPMILFAPIRVFLGIALTLPCCLWAQERAPLVAGRPAADWRDDLRNPQPIVRQAALEALSQFVEPTAVSVSVMTPLISDPDIAVRRTAIRAIGRSGRLARAAAPALWTAWRDDDALVSADAGIALVRIDGKHIRTLRDALQNDVPRDRARAAAALANAGPNARIAIHPLRDLLADHDSRVRGAALAALDALDATPGRRTASLLGASLTRELSDAPALTDAGAMSRAELALTLLSRAGRDARGASQALQRLLWDGPAPLRDRSARILGHVPGDGDVALSLAIAIGDSTVRDAAMNGLLAERNRRRPLRAVLDSLRAIDPLSDTMRTRTMIDAIGYVSSPSRAVTKALAQLLRRAPVFAPAITTAQRRLAIGH